uniref:BHLH domain-containing protein n=1 Tax=Aegilops tauschii subsp. strangulata TaxID=200361 RepID=A0A452XWX8_AEGTS
HKVYPRLATPQKQRGTRVGRLLRRDRSSYPAMAEEAQALGLALGLGAESSPGTTTVEVTRSGASRRRRSPRLERARRQTMSVLFDELGALLPDLPPRVRSLVRPFPFLAIILFVSPA